MKIKVKETLRSVRVFVLILIGQFLCLAAFAPLNSERPYYQTWNEKSGLPDNSINCLIQSKSGYIWMGTSAGLLRFDGVRFRLYNSSNTPDLSAEKISALFEEPDGTLWIGSEEMGVFTLKNGRWRNINTDDGLSNNKVNTIAGDWNGNVWVGTDYGLNLISNNDIQIFSSEDGLPDLIITALAVDNFGHLWIGTLRGGVSKLKDRIIQNVDSDEGLENLSITALRTDPKGKLWIGTFEGMYTLQPGENYVRYVKGTAYTPITSIMLMPENLVLAGTMSDGIIRLKGTNKKIFNSVSGLPDDFIQDILMDNSNNTWLGTEGSGLVKVNRPIIQNITESNGLPDNASSAVLIDKAGEIWLGTRNNGLLKIGKNGKTIRYNKEKGLSSNQIRVLYEDHLGKIWVGTYGGGVNKITGNRIEVYDESKGLNSNFVNAIHESTKQRLLVGTNKGLNSIYGNAISDIGLNAEIVSGEIRTIKKLRGTKMAFGTTDGLYVMNGFKLEERIPPDKNITFKVNAIHELSDSEILIATDSQGLYSWDGQKLINCSKAHGLVENQIFEIVSDPEGYLWFTGSKGVSRVSTQDLEDYFHGLTPYLTVSLYDENDGMLSQQCYGNGHPSGWLAKDGQLYLATNKGVAVLNASHFNQIKNAPKTIIENVYLDEISIYDKPASDKFKNPENVTFEITGIEFTAPQKMYFRYRLEGIDKDFKYLNPNQERKVTYRNLSPGEYEFHAQSMSRDGIWDKKGGRFKFSIFDSPYSSNMAKITYIIIFLFFLVIYFYMKRKRPINSSKSKYQTSALDNERAKEVIPRLNKLMDNEKVYLDPDLTMQTLSKRLKVHYNHLSQIINEHYELSYNDFINKHRIEEAKKRLQASIESGENVLEIMLECGFYSKSVFNSAFKKFTGMTPSRYRASIK